MRLIDADPLIRIASEYDDFMVDGHDILDAPTIDAVPVVHGHWIVYPDVCVCSECNEQSPGIFRYCPNCGALMDMEAKEGWE